MKKRARAGVLVLMVTSVAAALFAVPAAADRASRGPTTTIAETTTSSTAAGVASTSGGPVGAVCGDASILHGPATPPPGAVVVEPGQDLNAVTKAHPAGTTFYLAAGTHIFGDSEFAQVIPKTGNTYVGAPGAVLDGRGINRYAFTHGNATGVTIKHLKVTGFVPPLLERVVNQGAGVGWTVANNWITGNRGSGVGIGSGIVVRQNCLEANGTYGMSGWRPGVPGDSAIKNIVVDGNEFVGNNADDVENTIRPGCGCSGAMKFWDVSGAKITNNWIHHNKGPGIWADTNNIDFLIEGNTIEDNDGEGIWYEISYNARIANNVLRRNAIVKGQEFESRGDNFPVGAIYIAESGGDPAVVNAGAYTTLEITGNLLENNWAGVVLWENSGRFCGGSNPTQHCTQVPPATMQSCRAGSFADGVSTAGSTSFTSDKATFRPQDVGQPLTASVLPNGTTIAALVNDRTVSLSASATASSSAVGFVVGGRSATNEIEREPHYSACRWKTQNVAVHDNVFSFDKASIGCSSNKCGRSAVLSNYGTYPRWSPYQGNTIQQAVTFDRNNRFANNRYVGPWLFTPYAVNRYLSFAEWQAAPYGQDAGSTYTSTSTTTTTTAPTTTTTAPTSTTTTTVGTIPVDDLLPIADRYTPLPPSRILDSRDGTGAPATKLGAGRSLDLQVTGRGSVPATGVSAVVMNVTVTDPTAGSHLTVWPAGSSRPMASNLNYEGGQTVPNLVVAKVGAGGKVSLFNNSGEVNVIADVVGWYGEEGITIGDRYTPLPPSRILDSRYGTGAPATKLGAGRSLDLQVTGRGGVPATGVSAVVMNVTVTDPTAGSHLTVWPAGSSRPMASNLNYKGGQTVPNLVVAKVGAGGKVSLFNNSGEVNVIADVVGWY